MPSTHKIMRGVFPVPQAALALAVLLASSSAAAPRPHLLLLCIDDLGWADLSFRGGENPTPTLDGLARTGVELLQYYVQPVCSPTRSALMTSQYPFHTGLQHEVTIMPGSTAAIPLDVPTVAERLKSAGYATAMIGKWHLGYARPENTPPRRGFDSYLGYMQGQVDYYNKTIAQGMDFWRNETVAWDLVGQYSLDQYRAEADRVLEAYAASHATRAQREAEPHFLYFSHQTVHIPLEQRSGERACGHISDVWLRTYCGMLVELDGAVARMTGTYQRLGLWNNTLVLVTTDNGGMVNFANQTSEPATPDWPASVGCNWPLRGSKGTLFQGGVRGTAFITGGDDVIPAAARGKSFSGLAHAVDLPATLLAAAGVSDAQVDGYDLRPPALHGAARQRQDVPINIYERSLNYTAITDGTWKLIIGNGMFKRIQADGYWPVGSRTPIPAPQALNPNGVSLFNIQQDPTESKEVSEDNPSVVAALRKRLQGYMTGYTHIQANEPHLRANPKFHNGTWAPFLGDTFVQSG